MTKRLLLFLRAHLLRFISRMGVCYLVRAGRRWESSCRRWNMTLQLVAAIVNGDLRELTYPINIESRVEPVTMSYPDGARIYRRSLTFLLEMAFADLFPDADPVCRSLGRIGWLLLSGNGTRTVIRV